MSTLKVFGVDEFGADEAGLEVDTTTQVVEVDPSTVTLKAMDLLRQAAAAFLETKANHRDGMLRAGRLLHEYVLERLKIGDGQCEYQRRLHKATRYQANRDAAAGLGTSVARVTQLLHVAAVVEVLAPGGALGDLSYASLRWFRCAVQRVGYGKPVARNLRGKGEVGKGEVEPSDMERWRIRPGCDRWAGPLFRRAVREGWGSTRVRKEVEDKMQEDPPQSSKSQRRKSMDGVKAGGNAKAAPGDNLMRAVRVGNVKDVADMILTAIRSADNKEELSRLVLVGLTLGRVIEE